MTSSAAYLDLLVGGDSAEDNLGKVLGGEHPKADSANHTTLFDQSQRAMLPVNIVEDDPVTCHLR